VSSPRIETVPLIAHAIVTADVETARTLFREYAQGLDIDLCFQGFDRELAALPGDYAPPKGRLLIARIGGDVAGCIALRPFAPGVCEMKRLYVRPAHRRTGAGRRLAEFLIREARAVGYSRMRLDTLPVMTEALRLYESLGFRAIPPYRPNPVEGAVFLELDLAQPRA
jgi:putative acetyltransferase